jgi:hypothetical protein
VVVAEVEKLIQFVITVKIVFEYILKIYLAWKNIILIIFNVFYMFWYINVKKTWKNNFNIFLNKLTFKKIARNKNYSTAT